MLPIFPTTLVMLTLVSTPVYLQPLPKISIDLEELYGEALEAIFGVGVRLQALLDDPSTASSKNFMVSPLSIALIVGQLMLGAEGDFRKHLYQLMSIRDEHVAKNTVIRYYSNITGQTFDLPYARLHLQLGGLVKALEDKSPSKLFTLQTANALFLEKDLKLYNYFSRYLDLYNTEVVRANFSEDPVGSQELINDWASSHTNGLIKNVIPEPLPETARAVFSNSLYFLAEWETPFSDELNIKGMFHCSENKTAEVTYMRGYVENITYIDSKKLDLKMIAIPYKNNELAMYIMLPNESNKHAYHIRRFAESLSTQDVLDEIARAKRHDVTIQLPKMKLSNTISFLKPLQKYSVYKNNTPDVPLSGKEVLKTLEEQIANFTSFNTTEDVQLQLTNAVQGEDLPISDILQQMTLSVNEKGTEAAAVSVAIMDYIGGSKNFKVDRPFEFFIRHEATSAVLFWGTIVDPSS